MTNCLFQYSYEPPMSMHHIRLTFSSPKTCPVSKSFFPEKRIKLILSFHPLSPKQFLFLGFIIPIGTDTRPSISTKKRTASFVLRKGQKSVPRRGKLTTVNFPSTSLGFLYSLKYQQPHGLKTRKEAQQIRSGKLLSKTNNFLGI